MRSILLLTALFAATPSAFAMSIDWAGLYRIEWNQINKPSLGSPDMTKAYGLHSLQLSPKIVASDGVNIAAKFNVLGSQDPSYSHEQFGELWGAGITPSTNPVDNNVSARTKEPVGLTVNQLYLNVNQEYGTLVAGRAPLDFGLGLTYSAGNGPWDHWATVYDMVGYKFIVGNLSFMPIISRQSQDDYGVGNTVQDQMLQLVYDSVDSGSMIGFMVDRRQSSRAANDALVGPGQNGSPGTGTVVDAYSVQFVNFTLGRSWDSFRFKMEAGFQNGDVGVQSSTRGEFVKTNAYGAAIEMEFPNPESKFAWDLRLGVASGDDPSTVDREGYAFNRNYDVAMLLFNHRLGGRDFLETNLIKNPARSLSDSLDDEAISNVMYVTPRVKYAWNEKFDITNSITYAQLIANPTNSVDFNKSLGLEWDIELAYKPRSNVTWVNQLGLLSPGDAFKDGASNLDTSFTFGFVSKAAITF